jgi:hypothetical protein
MAYNEAKVEKDQQDTLDQLDEAYEIALLCYTKY